MKNSENWKYRKSEKLKIPKIPKIRKIENVENAKNTKNWKYQKSFEKIGNGKIQRIPQLKIRKIEIGIEKMKIRKIK